VTADEQHVSRPPGATGSGGNGESPAVPAPRAVSGSEPSRPPSRRRLGHHWLSPNNIIGSLIVVVVGSLVTVVSTGVWENWIGQDDDYATTRVLAWARGAVKEGPVKSAKDVTRVHPGNYYTAECWTHGDLVSYQSYKNDKWVRLKLSNGRTGYASAIFFKGNDQAGVPNEC
jgi:hypothetical protein